MTDYGKFHDFCRDSGNRWSTLPGVFFVPAIVEWLCVLFTLTSSSMQRMSLPDSCNFLRALLVPVLANIGMYSSLVNRPHAVGPAGEAAT
jgi:hypothetical protein